MSEWTEQKLGEFASLVNGYAFKSADFVASGVPLIKIKNVKPNKISLHDLSYVSEIVASGKEKYFIRPEDILITMSGNRIDGTSETWVGKVALFGIADRYLLNQRVGAIRLKSDSVSREFLAYALSSWDYQQYFINQANSSGGQANISPDIILETSINLPGLPEQKAIAEVLSSLDDKIDLLHRQNKTLESLAQTLFRQWFIEEADDSWEEINLSDIAEHVKDGVNPAKEPAKIFKHYSLPAFDEGMEPKLEVGRSILSNKYKVLENTILVSKLNPRTPRVWPIFGTIDEDSSVCSTEFQIVKPKNLSHYGFIYYFLKSHQVTHELAGAAGGTSGSHQRVNPDDIFNLGLLLPPHEKIEAFDKASSEQLKKIGINKLQIRTLTQLRDSLLPKLMSGQVACN